MPLIDRPIRIEKENLSVSLPKPVLEKLKAYVEFLGEAASPAYVVEKALEIVFKDKEFHDHVRSLAAEKFHPKKETVAA